MILRGSLLWYLLQEIKPADTKQEHLLIVHELKQTLDVTVFYVLQVFTNLKLLVLYISVLEFC